MEIRMVKCPTCGTVYNEAVGGQCPSCSGQQSVNTGFRPTAMPGSNGSFGFQNAPAANGFGSNTFAKTAPPSQNAGGVGINSFPKTARPPQDGPSINAFVTSSDSGMIGGSFPQTKPPSDSRFVHTQFHGESALTRTGMRATGWLVAIDGANEGKEYRIHTGYNYVGKDKGDIRVEGDNYISKERDSQIFFDDETCKFYISHVNGANALRVNGAPVVSGSQELQPYDRVTIGKTHFVFVPLCCEHFKWGGE